MGCLPDWSKSAQNEPQVGYFSTSTTGPFPVLFGQNQLFTMTFLKKTTLAALLFLAAILPAQNRDVRAIIELMRLEEKVWNAGDIEAYVALYAPDDSVRMIYKGGGIYGKPAILAFYQKYWPKEKMGQLRLEHDCIERLSRKYYYVSGHFYVNYPGQPDKKEVSGRFSGLMKKIGGKWYIYTDHSG